MSARERIGKLEALLARVAERTAEPRRVQPAFLAASVAAPVIAAPAATGSAPRIATPPPMRRAAASIPEVTIETSEEYIDESELEVSTEVVEVDVEEEGPEQAYAAQAASPQAEDEEPPVSSKRPIVEEPSDEEEPPTSFADADAPRHTPPPESGRQLAPSPAPPPHSARRPSAPPGAEADPVGNWREPGLAEPRKASVVPPPVAPPVSLPRPAQPAAQASQVPGQPAQVMRPQLGASTEIAKIEGHVAQAEASSFGDLLDTTLSI